MSWTTPEELVAQVERLWMQGRLLACTQRLSTGTGRGDEILKFPLQLRLRRPTPREFGEKFDAARAWIKALEQGSRAARGSGYDVQFEEVDSRQLGPNRVPAGAHILTRDDALALVGKTEAARRFDILVELTLPRFPALQDWLAIRPLRALEHFHDWERILDCLTWFRDHPRSGLYTRQIDVAGVDTKFIEARKGVLSELLDIVLPSAGIDARAMGAKGFEARYGLRTKPPLVRFRILDGSLAIAGLTDLAVPVEQFAQLSLHVQRVFIVENEITGLAFPQVASSLVVLGLGHAVNLISSAVWLGDCEIHYWSDIDTHGFAMLDRLRASFPHARSLTMDRDTLLAHREMWTTEDAPLVASLERLMPAEAELYADLRFDRLGRSVRLEQERIPFTWLLDRM
jgi:hypothetical protein